MQMNSIYLHKATRDTLRNWAAKVAEDTASHAFWFCPLLSGFWSSIFDWFSKAYNTPLSPDAELAIFGFSQHTSRLSGALQQSLMLGMVVAKKLVLKNWKSPSPPSFRMWITDMVSVIQMERLRHLRSDSMEKFSAAWDSFLGHLDKLTTQSASSDSSKV